MAILVVEDEFLLREFAADVLADSGFSVFQARDAEEALLVLGEHPEVEVLFTDINMPGSMDGLGLSREVFRRYPAIRRLITSGRISISAQEEARNGVRFIEKPYMPRDVVRVIREMLAAGDPTGSHRPHASLGQPAFARMQLRRAH